MNNVLRMYADETDINEDYVEWEPQGPEFDTRILCLLISCYCEESDEVKVREV